MMRVESFLVSRDAIGDQPKQQKPVPKANEENGLDKPERDRREDLNRIVETVNKTSELFNRHLKFKFYEKTNRTIIQIIDDKTDTVIREIPPEKLLDMAANMERAVGLIFDENV